MENINIYLSIFLLIIVFTMLYITLHTFKLKNIAGKNTFSLLCFSVVIYSFGYTMELYCHSLEGIIFWNYIEYIGLPLIPAFWMIFALKYCGKSHILSTKVYILIFTVPVITMILRFTNDLHHLYYTNILLYNNGVFDLISIQKGPWYFVNFIYASLVELLSSLVYWKLFFRTNAKMRPQALIMFLASIFPWISVNIITLYKTPYGIDIGPFALAISSVLFLLGMFKYSFLSLKPIARDKVFEWSKDGIIILDCNYFIIDFNASTSKIITTLSSNSIGEGIKEHLKDYTCITASIENSEESQFETENSGNHYYYSVKSLKIFDKRDRIIGYLVFFHDITTHINTLEKLNCIACTDELTGVFNRRYFTEHSQNVLARAKRYNHPLSFIILDLDLFKEINDKFGHLAGDEVLKNIGKICKGNIRSADLLGRFGGEEFMVLMPETPIEDAVILADRIRKKIESSEIIYNGESIKVTASLGVTGTSSVLGEDLNTFFKFADQALYAAKADGRNCVRSSILLGTEGTGKRSV